MPCILLTHLRADAERLAATIRHDHILLFFDDAVGCRTAEQQIQEALRLYPAAVYDPAAGCVRIQVRSGS